MLIPSCICKPHVILDSVNWETGKSSLNHYNLQTLFSNGQWSNIHLIEKYHQILSNSENFPKLSGIRIKLCFCELKMWDLRFLSWCTLSNSDHHLFGTGINNMGQIGYHEERPGHPLQVLIVPCPIKVSLPSTQIMFYRQQLKTYYR